MAVLAPEVVLTANAGGRARAAFRPIAGTAGSEVRPGHALVMLESSIPAA
ncbi:MAG: hypothetical protein QJR09_02320 [Micrococcus sp.]|nr:hypothetical protein [Micrococcus sp.]